MAATEDARGMRVRQRRSDWVDITGRRFGRLVALEDVGDPIHWRCRCDCGRESLPRKSDLRSGLSRSCGCYRDERRSETKRTHGGSKSRLYSIWNTMRIRCGEIGTRPHQAHARYKDKGVAVCPEWARSFETFRDWSLSNGYADHLTIDRIKSERGYEPSNCRWVTWLVNERARNNVVLTVESVSRIKAELARGVLGTGKRLAEEFGVSQQTICDIRKGRIWREVEPEPMTA